MKYPVITYNYSQVFMVSKYYSELKFCVVFYGYFVRIQNVK